MSAQNVVVPRPVWENLIHDISFLKKTIVALTKNYKPADWMDADEVKEYLKIKETRLKQLRNSGQIRLQRPANGRNVKYYRKDIIDYQEGNIIIETKKPAGGTAGD